MDQVVTILVGWSIDGGQWKKKSIFPYLFRIYLLICLVYSRGHRKAWFKMDLAALEIICFKQVGAVFLGGGLDSFSQPKKTYYFFVVYSHRCAQHLLISTLFHVCWGKSQLFWRCKETLGFPLYTCALTHKTLEKKIWKKAGFFEKKKIKIERRRRKRRRRWQPVITDQSSFGITLLPPSPPRVLWCVTVDNFFFFWKLLHF